MLSIFSYVSGPSVCPPWRCVLCPFFNWVVCRPGVELCEFFIYFGDQTLVRGIIGKYVLPYSLYSFHFDDGFFCCKEAFYLMKSHSFIFSFISLALGDISANVLPRGIKNMEHFTNLNLCVNLAQGPCSQIL